MREPCCVGAGTPRPAKTLLAAVLRPDNRATAVIPDGHRHPSGGTAVKATTVSTNELGDDETAASDTDEPRYAELHLGGASYVVYDRENHQAWVQSETTIPLAEAR